MTEHGEEYSEPFPIASSSQIVANGEILPSNDQPLNDNNGQEHRRPPLWRKSGHVFVAQLPKRSRPSMAPDIVKKGFLLCMRSVGDYGTSTRPSRYKPSREARYGRMTESWREVEVILTGFHISAYVTTPAIWPKRRLEYRVYLDKVRRPSRLELFMLSCLDHTFCLRFSASPGHDEFVTYTFRAHTATQCDEWYMSLYHLLPPSAKRPSPIDCDVFVPELDLHVHLPLPSNHDPQSWSDITMEHVKDTVLTVFSESEVSLPAAEEDLRMCWTTQGRAEWIFWKSISDNHHATDYAVCPQNIEQTHQLELRRADHMPNTIVLENDTLQEPPPVEGILIRLTDFSGKPILFKRASHVRLYFASFNQYLFYAPASQGIEPSSECYTSQDLSSWTRNQSPFAHAITSYPDEHFQPHEEQRRTDLISSAKGLIDLTEVAYVRRRFDLESENHQAHQRHESIASTVNNSSTTQIDFCRADNCSFELVMNNGLVMAFEAFTNKTRDLWVDMLSHLIVYWKAYTEAERDALAQPWLEKNQIVHQPSTDESRSVSDTVDTRVWNMCLYEGCRDIVKSGVMYIQPHGRNTLSQKLCILTASGTLIFFDLFVRSALSAIPVPSVSHTRKSALELDGCYVYSGTSSLVNIRHGQKSRYQRILQQLPDELQQQHSRPPRLFRDGLVSDDPDVECVFSLWKPKPRRYFSVQRKRFIVIRSSSTGMETSGETHTFLAPSRLDKDEWVSAMNQVLERLVRKNAPPL